MSKLAKKPTKLGVGGLTHQIKSTLNKTGTAWRNQTIAGAIASLESLDVDSSEFTAAADAAEGVQTELKDLAESAEVEVTDAGLEAAAIIALGSADAASYVRAARQARPSTESFFGQLPVDALAFATPAIEAFDDRDLSQFSAHSIAYNLLAPRQDELASMFFPLVVMTPDQAYFRADIRRVSVYEGAFHKLSGDRASFNKRNLVEAYRDPAVLENNATELVPYVADNNAANNARFVPAATIANWPVTIEGTTFETNFLKFSQGEFGYVGLCQHPGLLATGTFDQSDKIDTNVRLKEIAIAITKGGDTSYVSFDVSGIASSQFVAAQNAHAQATRLNFRTEELALTKDTKDISGATVPALSAMAAGAVARLKVKIDGDLHLEFGDLDLNGQAPTVAKLFDQNGRLATIAGSAVDGVTFALVGYTLDARRTNSNRRTRGTILDRDVYSENYLVGLLPPIVVQKSQLSDGTENDVDALVSATNLRATNLAITTILAYADQLKAVHAGIQSGLTAAVDGGSLQGIARTMVTPYYFEDTIDLVDAVNSINSGDKVADLRGYLTGYLANQAYEMAQNSGYVAALQLVNGNPDAKPCVLIGCDQVLENYIMIQGDDRSFGPGFEYEVVTSMDIRMYDTIIMTFHDKSTQGFSPMNFGNCIWIPELVATLPTVRNGANVNETMVQPRFRHICNLPVMAKFKVTGLENFIKNRTAVLMDNLEV